MLTTQQRGQQRDAAIVEFVRQFRFARRDQIQQMFFSGSQSKTVAQRRLKTICDRGELKHYSETRFTQNIFYPSGGQGRSTKANHYIAIVDCYLALRKSPGRMEKFAVEQQFGFLSNSLVADGVGRAGGVDFFLEVELSGARRRDKFLPYKQYYLSQKWKDSFAKWPLVVLVCEEPYREKLTREAHVHPIRFAVVTLSELQQGKGGMIFERYKMAGGGGSSAVRGGV